MTFAKAKHRGTEAQIESTDQTRDQTATVENPDRTLADTTSDKTRAETKPAQSSAKGKKSKWRLGRGFLLSTAVFAMAAATINSWMGHDTYYYPWDFKEFSTDELKVIDLKLQMRLAKESLLRPNEGEMEQLYAALGYLRLHQGKKTEAIYFLEKSVRSSLQYMGFDQHAPYFLTRIYLEQGRTADALKVLDTWGSDSSGSIQTTLYAQSVPYHMLRAKVLEAAGQIDEAKAARKRAERSSYMPRYLHLPGDPTYRTTHRPFLEIYTMGVTALALEDYAKAKHLLKVAIEGMPGIPSDNDTRQAALMMMAVADFQSGDWKSAEKSFEIASHIPRSDATEARPAFCKAYSEFLTAQHRVMEASKYKEELSRYTAELMDKGYYFGK